VATTVQGTDAFQEADVVGASKPCTKWSTMIDDENKIHTITDLAFYTMKNDRPGPVLLDLPKNIMSKTVNDEHIKPLVFGESVTKGTILPKTISSFISGSNRPLILAGHGVISSNATTELRNISIMYNIPVTTTLLGLGAVNERSPLALQMLGMHGSYTANMAVQNCDLLINIGSRFDDRIIGDPKQFAKNAVIIHIDISDKNINKVVKAHHHIIGDCKTVLCDILKHNPYYPEIHAYLGTQIRKPWIYKIESWKKRNPAWNEVWGSRSVLYGRQVISCINKIIWSTNHPTKFTIVADVGAHQMWAAQYIQYDYPRVKFMTSGGLGSMGFAVPAAIGAKMASEKSEQVICICGDGGFTMSFVEILTAIENKVNVKIIIINNNYQLMVKMWQDKFYEGRRLGVKMNNPQFEEVCRAMGCASVLIQGSDGLEAALRDVLNHEDGPIVANVITDSDEPVLPMVSPGKALDDMILKDDKIQIEGDAPC
jgi:acetolactate synthase-1/2/3 large subunit